MEPNHIPSPEQLQAFAKGTLVDHLGIEFTESSAQSVSARMPVDHRTVQPFRILHGGASVALAETLGSIAAHYLAGPGKQCVGLEINANHVRAVRSGFVTGTATPLHLGRTTQVWQIRIEDEGKNLVCISRITMAVLEAPKS